MTPSYFERLDANRFKPTAHASGAWRSDEQHFSPLGGLLVHAIERSGARPGLLMSRIGFDILGKIDLDEFEVRVETVRPGRTIELVEATAIIADRPVVRARAWYLSAQDTSAVAGGGAEPLPHPDTLEPWAMSSLWSGGFIASLDARTVGDPQPGRTTAWVSTSHDLVAGEEASPLASFIALVDTANGIAVRQDPTEWMFPNVDLTIHLHRQPEGRWTGLDTSVVFGGDGRGITSTVLHDTRGPVGRAEQMLTVRPLAR
ncbi:thioesterase family protein [Saccharopolyspora hordei]|uniref:Thioesterase family protein n=1 Tax=Saccharopolyspora hordei TaxID=1838 RepID=A0A853AR73_9PSEU|nr:thioesterase family protein [Saccharopolyspora hordei]NYI83581.1 hypothetical protein [Saccharopolyspora hordei]